MIVEKRQRIRKCFKNNAGLPDKPEEWERIVGKTELSQHVRKQKYRLSTPDDQGGWEDESALAPVTKPKIAIYVIALISGIAYFAVSSFFFTG